MTQSVGSRFAGRVALVTGGAGGIGAATAERFARDGAKVVVADIEEAAVTAVAEKLAAEGLDVSAARCDQTSPKDVAALFDVQLAEGVDIVFANAGWGRTDPFLDISFDTWRQTYDINVHGTFLVCQAAARKMVAQGRGGSIVITSSSGATETAALFAAYCSAKAALNMLAGVMALELGAHDIRVNSIMPGVTKTAMTEGLLETRARDGLEFGSPLGRLGAPDDIASVATFLASDDAAFINGQSIMVDGGGSLNGPQWFVTDFRKRGETNWQLAYKTMKLDR